MKCQICTRNEARYIAIDLDGSSSIHTCGLCPIKHKLDSVPYRLVGQMLMQVRELLDALDGWEPNKRVQNAANEIRALIGKDVSP